MDVPSIDLLEGLATTRSIRRYTDEVVPDEVLSDVLWRATRAPSGSNRQPFRFVVLRDSDAARRVKGILGSAFRAGWRAKRATDRYADGSGSDDDSPKARQARAMQSFVDDFERIPVVILACLDRYREPNPYEGASVYPACQNLLLAARAHGFGATLTMWHLAVEDELRRELSIPDHVALSACITLGRPAGAHGPVRRRPIGEVVFEDRWGSSASWAHDPQGTRFTAAGPPGREGRASR